jgi:hypothetical protein
VQHLEYAQGAHREATLFSEATNEQRRRTRCRALPPRGAAAAVAVNRFFQKLGALATPVADRERLEARCPTLLLSVSHRPKGKDQVPENRTEQALHATIRRSLPSSSTEEG